MSVVVRACSSITDVTAAEASFPSGLFAFHERRFSQKDGSVYLLAWLGAAVVGHVMVLPQSKYPEVQAALGIFPEVNALAVAESYRRQGIATALMQAAEATTLDWGQTRLGLAVEPDNDSAIRLYEGIGFRKQNTLTPTDIWTWTDARGKSHEERAICAYYLKDVLGYPGRLQK